MSKTLLIGDIHGKWISYYNLLKSYAPDRSIQLGDFGWGFPGSKLDEKDINDKMTKLPGDHRYFRGNHDNPEACATHIYCLDDTYWEPDSGLMIIAGANSIDAAWRVPGINWWEDEELSYSKLDETITLYEERKPRIVLSHDGPEDIISHMFPWYRKEYSSRTRDALNTMFKIHQPELHVFGHWHTSRKLHYNGTDFVCLAELEPLMIDL